VRKRRVRRASGQGVVEYLLLIGLLLIAAISIWVLVGPGIDTVYREIVAPQSAAPASVETGISDGPIVSPAAPLPDAACGRFSLVGEARILAGNDGGSALTLALGGRTDCNLVVAAGPDPADTLALDPVAKPARLHCASVGDIIFPGVAMDDTARTFFPLERQEVALRIIDRFDADASRPALFEAILQPDHLVVERGAVILRGSLVAVQGDNRIDSPALAAMQTAGAATWLMTLQPYSGDEASDFIDDRPSLRHLRGLFRLEAASPGCQ
jgi:hypothetical protein